MVWRAFLSRLCSFSVYFLFSLYCFAFFHFLWIIRMYMKYTLCLVWMIASDSWVWEMGRKFYTPELQLVYVQGLYSLLDRSCQLSLHDYHRNPTCTKNSLTAASEKLYFVVFPCRFHCSLQITLLWVYIFNWLKMQLRGCTCKSYRGCLRFNLARWISN